MIFFGHKGYSLANKVLTDDARANIPNVEATSCF